jgi:hypothetical protein
MHKSTQATQNDDEKMNEDDDARKVNQLIEVSTACEGN